MTFLAVFSLLYLTYVLFCFWIRCMFRIENKSMVKQHILFVIVVLIIVGFEQEIRIPRQMKIEKLKQEQREEERNRRYESYLNTRPLPHY